MTICGLDCCEECMKFEICGGCEKCSGHPFGGTCTAAEIIRSQGADAFSKLKRELIEEINSFRLPELHVEDLNLLSGGYVNLAYPLPSGAAVPFLKENNIYLGNQIERGSSDRCYGVVADSKFVLVCEYGCSGSDPRLLLFKCREKQGE